MQRKIMLARWNKKTWAASLPLKLAAMDMHQTGYKHFSSG
ncbi:putative transcriptional regulator domain protein [Enterobacter hormaechei]|nr:putative transcriptional regulator domain protein [Enterobacter hormaechei]CDL31049.1 hypothetical protein [Enterobacter hormaechei]